MAGVRHAFISNDGRTGAEWRKVGRQVDCLAFAGIGPDWAVPYDLLWIHAGAVQGATHEHLELVRRLASTRPCIVLADIPTDHDALASFSAGARGYCNSHAQLRVLKLVSDVVLRGGLWVGEPLLHRLMRGIGHSMESRASGEATPARALASADLLAALSVRERQVAEAIATGASNKEVARLLNISERTVKAHASTIFDKLGVKDRLQLAIRIMGLRK